MSYDPQNVFARISRGEIPINQKIYEDDYALAFHSLHPRRKIHAVIITKGPYYDATDFALHASDAEIVGLHRAIGQVAKALGVVESGYRLISNTAGHGGQEVPHLHYHLLAGEEIGPLVG